MKQTTLWTKPIYIYNESFAIHSSFAYYVLRYPVIAFPPNSRNYRAVSFFLSALYIKCSSMNAASLISPLIFRTERPITLRNKRTHFIKVQFIVKVSILIIDQFFKNKKLKKKKKRTSLISLWILNGQKENSFLGDSYDLTLRLTNKKKQSTT